MRKIITALALFIAAASCSRSTPGDSPDNGCITRVVHPQSETQLTAEEIVNADSLMDANHIDHSHFSYVYLTHQNFRNNVAPFNSVDEKIIFVITYVNGLKVLNAGSTWYFYNGVLQKVEWEKKYDTPLDTVPSLSLAQLRTSFTAQLRKNAATIPKGSTDSCYKAEFGYFDLNTTSIFDSTSNLVKAWRVSTNAYGSLPMAYYKDDGTLISFIGSVWLE